MKTLIILLSAFCIFVLASCNGGQSSNTTEISDNTINEENISNEVVEWNNTHCPVMEGKVKEDGGSTMYQGKLVRFCCSKCVKKFNDNPEEYHEALISYSSGKKPDNDSEHDHSNHEHGHDHSGHDH